MGATGCSFGGYHAINFALRHPDMVTYAVSMSGAFDIPQRFLDGYYNDDAYLHSPARLPARTLNDPWFLERIRSNYYVLAVGNGDPLFDQNVKLAHVLGSQADSARPGRVGGLRPRLAVVAQDGSRSFSCSKETAWRKSAFFTGWKSRFRRRWWTASTRMGVTGVTAEHLKVGGVRMAEPCGYDVIVDRISHDIPFYRSYLKNAVLDRHQGHQQSVLVERRRQILQLRAGRETGRRRAAHRAAAAQEASRRHHRPQSMRNLEYPLDWDGIFDYIGFPAFLKPHDGGGWKNVYKVDTPEEFFAAYDESERPLHDAAGRASNSRSTSAAT